MDTEIMSKTSALALQELVQERTATRIKRCREKLQKDLQMLAEMKSKDGVHPFGLFPKEIWLKIMRKVGPMDLRNMWAVHPVFQELTEPFRVQNILFPQALQVILDYENSKCGGQDRHEISDFRIRSFFKLRKVSKCLQHAIDHWFEVKIEEEIQLPCNNWKIQGWNKAPCLSFTIVRDLDRLERMANYDVVNELLFVRSITLVVNAESFYVSELGEEEEYRLELMPLHGITEAFNAIQLALLCLLELVGDQIWRFSFQIRDFRVFHDYVSVSDIYVCLQQFCTFMPNLKRLDFSIDFGMEEQEEEAFYDVTAIPQDLEPFPKLSKLVRIDLNQAQTLYATKEIYEAILTANSHIKILNIMGSDKLLGMVSPNIIKALSLESFSCGNHANCSSLPITNLEKSLLNCAWPLNCLELRVNSVYRSFNYLLIFLEQYPMLEKVSLDLENIFIGDGIKYMNLPRLTLFKLKFSGLISYISEGTKKFFSMQFLYLSKKLKMISWLDFAKDKKRFRYMENYKCEENAFFEHGNIDRKHSTIWDVFPELKTIDVQISDGGMPFLRNTIKRFHRYERIYVPK